jgi:hypothetical protein
MATLNELGRNSSSITYGPYTNGADNWPVMQLFDQWTKNDTMQGTVTASSTTITGVGTIFTTQLRAGDVIMIAGQMRTIAAVASDTSASVTSGFSPSITIASALKQINSSFGGTGGAIAGTVAITVRNNTTGVISVTNGSQTINGVGTYFLSDMTNSVTTVSITGTVAVDTSGNITGTGTTFQSQQGTVSQGLQPGDSVLIGSFYGVVATVSSDTAATLISGPASPITAGTSIAKATNGVVGRTININGRIRQVLSITSNTVMQVNIAMDFTDSNLRYKVYPRGTLAVTAGSATVTGTNTNFSWDLVTGDQVWIGDELRTFSFSTNATTAATLTDYTGFSGTAIGVLRQAVSGIPFYRDDTYITGSTTNFLNELRVGDDLIIDGTEVTVVGNPTNSASGTLPFSSSPISATSFRINYPFTHTMTSSTVYKKRKVHGYNFEGTREGAATGGKFTTLTTSATAANSLNAYGQLTLNIATATNFVQYQLIKVQAGGGPSTVLTGQANTIAASSTVTGTNTLFTTQLHVGAEIMIAGQYMYVTAIASDTSLTVSQTVTTTGTSPIYRTIPLYTYIAAISGTTITLGTPLKNNIFSVSANPPVVSTPSGASDYVEFVYSAPNYSADNLTGGGTATTSVTSFDRKFIGFRFYPLATGGGSGNTVATAGGAYNFVVYERWTGAYYGNGVGINKADLSDSTSAVSGTTDQTAMTLLTGGFIYLFAHPRYYCLQGKTFSNIQQQWLGCIEFERAQPEDSASGLGTTSGISIYTGAPVSGTPGVSPWPCFGYVCGNRFPVGASQTPTLPVSQTTAVHGCVIASPRVRCSTGDLVGVSAHVYSGMTITTGMWGHMWEFAGSGAYASPGSPSAGSLPAQTAGYFIQQHMGQLVPVYTNVYNSKRFMFSPVVVLGPKYDPDVRGRLYGLKVIPSALGTLMDTVSVTIDSNFFYSSVGTATDHWVLTTPPVQSAGNAIVQTYRISLAATVTLTQQYRSLEDTNINSANTSTAFTNNFRWAIPT